MFLERIELSGFKSFAAPTTITLTPGLTVVVGPNGAGKSNLVDALRWVLAVGTAHQLRAGNQEDLLFQGSARRRPAQVAEVKVVFQHDGELPVPQREVAVSRRLYRGGESEYRLNGIPCRRRDVTRLFVGTGFGDAGYAVIGQGNIEAVLSMDAWQRRLLLEEAAGATPYREERKAAILDLQQADVALADVLRELEALEARRGPLAAEVQRLREAAELRASLYRAEVEALRHRRADALARHAQALDALRQREDEAARLEAAEAALLAARNDLWAIGEGVRLAVRAVDDDVARVEVASERARAEAAAFGERQEFLGRALLRERELVERSQHRRRDHEERVQALRAALAALREVVPAEPLPPGLPRDPSALVGRRDELLARLGSLEAECQELRRRAAELAAALRTARQEGTEARQALAELRRNLAGRREALLEARAAWQREEARQAAAEERNLRPAARAVLEAGRAGQLRGIVGALGELVAVPEDLELALTVALGGQFDAVVTRDEDAAAAAIAYLRSRRIGVATFLPLDLLRPRRPSPAPPPGAVGWLLDLVEVEADIMPAAAAVLGGILVVPDFDTAVALLRKTSPRPRSVTLAGEQVFPTGTVTGGHVHLRRLPNRQRLAETRARLSALESEVRRMEEEGSRLAAATEQHAAEEERLGRLAATLAMAEEDASRERRRLEEELAAIEPWLDRLEAFGRAATAHEESLRLLGNLEQEERALAEAADDEAEHAARLAEIEVELARLVAEAPRPEQDEEGRLAALLAQRKAWRRLETAVAAMARQLDALLRRVGVAQGHARADMARQGEVAEEAKREADELALRLREEFAADLTGPAAPADPARLARLRRRLAEMAGARPESEELLRALDARRATLEERRRDLLAAKDGLLRTMARADEALEERVERALALCEEAFRQRLAELFSGGSGSLLLRPEGLELSARLPGKERSRLSLYSGGERSLIALAFLLALAALRPSPVQVLDEADASLDEENAERLVRFLKQRPGEQYLLVSHQRVTMEAADVLVGLTMQEPGVTTVVEVRLDGRDEGTLGTVSGGATEHA